MANRFKTALDCCEFVYTAELVLGRDHSIPEAEEFVRAAARFPRMKYIVFPGNVGTETSMTDVVQALRAGR